MGRNFIFFFTLLCFVSCDLPKHFFSPEPVCKVKNPNDLREEEQKKLISLLKDKQSEDYRYFFKTFAEEGNQVFMQVNFRSQASCFDIKMLVDKWDKLGLMRPTNGQYYPRELYDLKWKITMLDGKEMVKYVDMHKILD